MFDFVLQTFIKSNLNPEQNKETQILPVSNLVLPYDQNLRILRQTD